MEKQAKVVIIGGGIMGCSLAYHLAKEGWSDIILLEKAELTSGSTWHAAGQITHSVSHYGLAKMAAYGTELYPTLEAETGQNATWHGCGSLRVAYTPEEVDWLHYTRSIGRGLGHEMEIVGPDRIRALHPFYTLDGILAALHTPHDGHVDPAGVSFGLAAGARQRGAKVIRHNRATDITRTDGGEWIVHTEQGAIRCEIVVNAGGTYARQIGQWVGLDLPIANLLHHYLITDPVPEFQDLGQELPVVRDDRQVSGYIRMEQKSGLVGIYEKANAATIWDDGTPWEAENELFEADYDRIMPWLENAMERMPIFADLGLKRVVHGAITHPPDGNMMLGPSGLRNFWLCCGSQVGIAWGPGAGKYLAQWMVHGSADISMASFDPRRFGARIDDAYRIGKAKEDYLLRHEIPFPHLDRPAYRPSHSKTSPLYDVLKEKGAVYQDVYGWERPYWYATGDVPQDHIHAFRRSALHDIVGAEVTGLRAAAGIADLTAFSKIEISGPDAEAYLSRVQSNKLPKKTGSIMLTYLVNPNGRLEGEATLVRLGEDRFYAVYAAAKEASLLNWMEEQSAPGERVVFENVSADRGVLMLAGPKARDIFASCTEAPLDNKSFRWLSSQQVTVAGVSDVRAMRVTYTGELGWELHVPMTGMRAVYEALVAAGEPLGLVHVGSAALNAMRMEKAYKSGHEITNEVTLAEAGLERFSRPDGFQGAEISLARPEKWVVALLRLEEPAADQVQADPLGSESIWLDGKCVGSIASGGYGYAVGAWLGWAYVNPSVAAPGTVLDVTGIERTIKATVLADAVFDPANDRPRVDAEAVLAAE
ncbi:MAG: FAD-dependent oxidoreductase [Alphaproteobacteria bacterium]|nr:FAD-dependent oxidoreductase [Alphaproteobacteria bacterium]